MFNSLLCLLNVLSMITPEKVDNKVSLEGPVQALKRRLWREAFICLSSSFSSSSPVVHTLWGAVIWWWSAPHGKEFLNTAERPVIDLQGWTQAIDQNRKARIKDQRGWFYRSAQTERAGADCQWDGACGQNEIIHPPKYLDKERQIMPSTGENAEQLKFSYLAGESENCHRHFAQWHIPTKMEHTPCLQPSYFISK